jgi:hypothetical protein
MKFKIASLLLAVAFIGCDKIKDKVNGQLDNQQTSFVEADIEYDNKVEHIAPNICNPIRGLDFYTINATTIDNAPILGVNGTFKSTGEIERSDDTDIFMVFRKGTGNDDENLYNSVITGPHFIESKIKINVTKLEGKIIMGTFEGVLYNKNGDSCIVRNGTFDATTKL